LCAWHHASFASCFPARAPSAVDAHACVRYHSASDMPEVCRAPIPPLTVRPPGLLGLLDLSRACAPPARRAPPACGGSRRHAGGLGVAQQGAHPARRLHGAPDVRVVGILVEKQHDLAGRALPGKAILQSPGAVAKYALAPGAADLNKVDHMGPWREYAPNLTTEILNRLQTPASGRRNIITSENSAGSRHRAFRCRESACAARA
jgi:hypothetical protein